MTRRRTMKRLLVLLAVVGALAAAAGVNQAKTARSQSPDLAGRWAHVNTCQELVAALKKAGLRRLAPGVLAGNELVPGTARQLAHKRHICAGATPRLHSHFFTADGKFGSVDDPTDQQVDDGTYRLIDDHTIQIDNSDFSGARFRYEIVNGDALTLTPLITAAMKRQALAHPLRFSTAGWMVSVAYTGQAWNRVPCNQWCSTP